MKRRDFLKGTAQTAVGVAAIATVGIPKAMAVPKQVWTGQHVKAGLRYAPSPIEFGLAPIKQEGALIDFDTYEVITRAHKRKTDAEKDYEGIFGDSGL